jgi:hypothetical protein
MGGIKPNRSVTQKNDMQLINAIQKDLPPMSSLQLGGTAFTTPSLVAFLQSRIDAATQVENAKQKLNDALSAYQTVNDRTRVIVRDLKRYAIHRFGESSATLADFGIVPKRAGEP